jgi:hypothetical protein
MRLTILLLVLSAAGLTAGKGEADAGHQQFVIGISPFLEKSVKNDVYRGLVRLLVEDLPLDSTVAVFDAFHLKSITRVTLPNQRAFTSAKTRANQFAPAIQDLKSFLATEHAKPAHPRLQFEGALRVPQFRAFLSETLPTTHSACALLLIGSPLYQDAKEPAFSMVDGYFPSDGHLQVSWEQSVYGLRGRTNSVATLSVHWAYFGDPWQSDLHREKVTRFWHLYLERHAARLATFSGDLATVLRAFPKGVSASGPIPSGWAIDPRQTKVEMLRTGRDVEVSDWIARDTPSNLALHPPGTLVGPMKIGIRWSASVDLDLYAKPRRGAETLYFEHVRSPEGYYYKDHRSSPGREFEFVEFESPVDVREIDASINFYEGSWPGGARGEVRIEFDGRIYSAPFIIPASEGNRGRSGRRQQDFWVKIPVQTVLKLDAAGG